MMFMIKNKIAFTPEEELNKLDKKINDVIDQTIKFKEKKYNYLNEPYRKKFTAKVEYMMKKAKETIK